MFKKFVSSLLAITVLVGCSSGSTSSSYSEKTPAELTAYIVEQLSLEENVSEVEERIIPGLFFFEDEVYEEGSFYVADKIADCIAVFKVTDTDSCIDTIEEYLSTRKAQLQMYAPSEVFKVDNAVIESNDDTVIMIVCDNLESAKDLAKEILGL